MLTNLHVKNLALIDETDVYFEKGLNILTGETGAGKSIILGSVNIALGGKTSSDVIRKNCDYALTELTFHIEDEEKLQLLNEYGIEDLEYGDIIISRKIMPSRSQFKVNGQNFTAGQVKKIAEILIDIHGQHDNQLLLNENKHLDVIDRYAESIIQPLKEELAQIYKQYSQAKNRLKEMDIDAEARNREISFMEYEINEIMSAGLLEDEDCNLEADYKKMLHMQKIMDEVSLAQSRLFDGDNNASDAVSMAVRSVSSVVQFDDSLAGIESTLTDIESLMCDVSGMLRDYMDENSFDEVTFEQTRQRLDLINSLKMKYGNSISEIIKYAENKTEKLEELKNYDKIIKSLNIAYTEKEAELVEICSRLTQARKKSAVRLCDDIRKSLSELNFSDVKFDAEFSINDSYTANGNDSVRFMISTNTGEDLKPLSKIASGGELSRIMLAIKTVIAAQDRIETLIFDEIDAGISGRTAQLVGEKLNQLSENCQIICITHLPQIAVMADTHFLISKSVEHEKTTTSIIKLNKDEMIEELARLLGGSNITDTVLSSAKEMKKLAGK